MIDENRYLYCMLNWLITVNYEKWITWVIIWYFCCQSFNSYTYSFPQRLDYYTPAINVYGSPYPTFNTILLYDSHFDWVETESQYIFD